MSQLSDLVDPSAIRLDAPADDWREAIRVSGELLVATGAIGDSYLEAMVRTVEEHGPYIVITPGFALAHSRPDDSVARTGLSFVRLARPVAFGHESNDPVHLVMALAAADDSAHRDALAALAGVLADEDSRRALDRAATPQEVLSALGAQDVAGAESPVAGASETEDATDARSPAADGTAADVAAGSTAGAPAAATAAAAEAIPSKNLILTVCGNGLGTSLFLKNTAEQVLDHWGWSPYLTIEATDTISAKGRASDADVILTSGAIAETLGDLGVPVEVIENFTSKAEIDAALRRLYAI